MKYKKSKLWKMDDKQLEEISNRSFSRTSLLKNLGFKTVCKNQIDCVFYIYNERGISLQHILSKSEAISKTAGLRNQSVVDLWINDPLYDPTVKGWQKTLKNPIRDWIMDRANNKCQECGWNVINIYTNKCPLHVHHVDGDADNNRPENLKVLCPNCHSLTPNYGSRNIISSRVCRKK